MSGFFVTNPNLFSYPGPVCDDWDPTFYAQQIAQLPTLQCFFRFTDVTKITKDGSNLVTAVADTGPKGLVARAEGAFRPTWVDAGMEVCPALFFGGAQNLRIDNMFAGGPRGSVCCVLWPSGADVTSRIYVADASDSNPNLYGTNAVFRGYSADVQNAEPDIVSARHCLIMTWDHTVAPGVINLYTNKDVVSATTVRTRPVGEGILGSFGTNANYMIGYMAAVAVLNEDVSRNPAVLSLLRSYARAEAHVAVV